MQQDLLEPEGLGAPSQKTSLLGGVAQILISPRPSPRLADVGLFVRPKPNNPPSNKESPCKLYYLHTGRSNAPSRYRLLSVTPLHYGANFLESQIVALQGLIALFSPSGVGRPIAPLRHWGIYIPSNITHTHD